MAKEKKISEMDVEELQAKLIEYRDSLFNFRFQKSLQQLEHPKIISRTKKKIARVKTFIRQNEMKVK